MRPGHSRGSGPHPFPIPSREARDDGVRDEEKTGERTVIMITRRLETEQMTVWRLIGLVAAALALYTVYAWLAIR